MNDLRQFLKQLDSNGEILRIGRPINKDSPFQVSAIMEKLAQEKLYPVVQFENPVSLSGSKSRFPLVYNVFATRERCATALGLEKHQKRNELSIQFARLEEKKINPKIVPFNEAPVHQNVIINADIDLSIFPLCMYHELDIGPYFTMACIMKGYEKDFYDVSFIKNLYKGKNKLSASLTNPHLKIIKGEFEKNNKNTPIVICLGHHPSFFLGSLALMPYQNNDYETIGSFLNEPLRLTPSQTWGNEFLVPADAEILIEGEIPPYTKEVEGPFGEFSGYYQTQWLKPIINVTAITYREEAIMQAIYPGHSEHYILGGLPKEGSILNAVKRAVPTVTGVHMPSSGCGRFTCYISLKKSSSSDPKRAGVIPFVELPNFIQMVVVVDDDVDIYNEEEVMWALATRFRYETGLNVIKDMEGNHGWLDKNKIFFDATVPAKEAFPIKSKVPPKEMLRTDLKDWIDWGK